MEVNGTYWKDPSFPNDPDNWVYAPTACPCCYFLWASCTAQAENLREVMLLWGISTTQMYCVLMWALVSWPSGVYTPLKGSKMGLPGKMLLGRSLFHRHPEP